MGSTSISSKHQARLKNYISWFEIPVYDIHRAAAFYNAIYGIEMDISINGEFAMAYFPADNGVGGALIAGPGCFPSDVGALIYLNAGNDLNEVLGRVERAGGRVIMPKTLISKDAGNFALFIDSEGNRLALHEGTMRTATKTVEAKVTKSTGAAKAAKKPGGKAVKKAPKKAPTRRR